MPRFKFRMQALLNVRLAARDERRALLNEALEAQSRLDARRAELESDLHQQKSWFRAGIAPGRIDVDRLLTTSRYELVVRAELAVIARHEQQLAVEIDRRRQALVEAERDVRVLEKLRERQQEEFRAQQALAEIKQYDETASRAAFTRETV